MLCLVPRPSNGHNVSEGMRGDKPLISIKVSTYVHMFFGARETPRLLAGRAPRPQFKRDAASGQASAQLAGLADLLDLHASTHIGLAQVQSNSHPTTRK